MAELLGKAGPWIIAVAACVIGMGFVFLRWNHRWLAAREHPSAEIVLHRHRVPLSIVGGILWMATVARGAFDADQGEGGNEGVLAAAVVVTGTVLLCAFWSFRMPGSAQGPARERVGRKLMTVGGTMLLLPFLWFQPVIAGLFFLGALLRTQLPKSLTGWRSDHLWFLIAGSAAILTRWAVLPEEGAGWPGFLLIAGFGLSWVAIGATERRR